MLPPTNRQLAVRLAVTRALSHAHDLDGIYEAALDALAECLDVSRASVLLFDADGVMQFKAYRGLSSEYRAAVQGHSPWSPESTNPDPLLVPDVTREPSLAPYLPQIARERIAAMAFIPLVSLGRVIGKFMLYYDAPHAFGDEEVALARVIASAVAFAVERARVNDEPARCRKDEVTFSPAAPWRDEAFRAGQHQVLEMIATGAPLGEILTLLAHLIEDQCAGILCSVVLLDADGVHMRHGAAPSLPAAYCAHVDGKPIGPRVGSCGTAMHSGRLVVVTDILLDPLWDGVRDVAIAHGLRASWSMPILSPQKKVLGSFGMYYATPRGPSHDELRLIDTVADLAGIAIEHQRSQEALRQSEERNRAILRALPDWMFIVSADGVFLDYHGRDSNNLLVPPEMFLGRSVYDVLPPALVQTHQRALERALRTNEPETFEYSLDIRHETRFYEACIVRCDTDKALSIVRDITDRKRAELDAEARRRELAHLNRVMMLGELSGALAHELSQPLAAILTNAQAARRLLEQSPPNLPEVLEALDDIIRNDRRAGAVIQRLRTLLKKGDTPLLPISLNEVIREVLDLARSDLLVRRISVDTSFTPDEPRVLGDRVQLQQVVLNLILNACDAMTDLEPANRRLALRTTLEDGYLEVSVSDGGPGIPEDQLNAVFEPFVTFREDGLGLGLAISRSIVLGHGGRIVAKNNNDHGVTFRCFLPVATG